MNLPSTWWLTLNCDDGTRTPWLCRNWTVPKLQYLSRFTYSPPPPLVSHGDASRLIECYLAIGACDVAEVILFFAFVPNLTTLDIVDNGLEESVLDAGVRSELSPAVLLALIYLGLRLCVARAQASEDFSQPSLADISATCLSTQRSATGLRKRSSTFTQRTKNWRSICKGIIFIANM